MKMRLMVIYFRSFVKHRRLHEHRPGENRGVREWDITELIRRCLCEREQWYVIVACLSEHSTN